MKRSATARIDEMCRLDCLEKETVYKRSKMVLEAYRDLCWKTVRDVEFVREDLIHYCSSDMDSALIYLETFAPDERRDYFESRIRSLFDNQYMTEMVDLAIVRVREYPEYGKLYYDILTMCYLYRSQCKESEILEILGIERSNFYNKKKQAITVFGLAMHDAICKMKDAVGKNRMEARLHPTAAISEMAAI